MVNAKFLFLFVVVVVSLLFPSDLCSLSGNTQLLFFTIENVTKSNITLFLPAAYLRLLSICNCFLRLIYADA